MLAGSVGAESVTVGTGAVLRGLDKVSGKTTDIELANGTTTEYGRLVISLGECRYPEGNASGDAYAFLTVRDKGATENAFSGWMVASAPSLNALDHSRYDVWVTRCKTK
ncbi:DUF2155 domain-containing protein [Lentibacter algarum]|uniref:DUF2155 domain-containing protein n=1 Tax=Lentibacter algarum TaxID=576131 RepID=UPI002091A8F6|nr:DUF2155 domain-containing protein [Lentibacter algarum]